MKICPTCQTEYADDIEFCSKDGMKLRRVREVSEDPMIGRALDGRWIIDSKLGEGGMGAVYEGRQKSVNRKVAIKTLRPQLADNDEFVDRFFREAKVATTINHPHCVTILDFGQDADETLYLAMEYLEGEALADRMARGAMTLQDILRVGVQVTSALAAAHSHQIIHRDLKPDNIYLLEIPGGGVFAKVLDFGIAKVNTEGATQYTRTGQVFGTPDYMSPEQCSGYDLDGRSDLYALGCILYEMVLGKTPFTSPSSNSMAILMAHIHEKPAPPSAQGVTLPAEVESLIMRLLDKEPNARAESASSLNRELEVLLAGLEGDMVPSLSGAMSAATAFDATAAHATHGLMAAPRPPTANTTPQLAPPAAQTTRSVAPLIAVGVLVAIAIAGASVFAISLASQDDPAAATAAATTAPPDEAPPGEVATTSNGTTEGDTPAEVPPAETDGTEPAVAPTPDEDNTVAAADPKEDAEPTKKAKTTKKASKPKTSKKKTAATNRDPIRTVEDVNDAIDTFRRDTKKVTSDIERQTDAMDVLLDSNRKKAASKRKKARERRKKKRKKKRKDAMDMMGF